MLHGPITSTRFLTLGGPTRVIAHRGCSGARPENTLCAFAAAIELGVDMVELDVQSSADGGVVVIHDSTLERTTDGEGPVAARTRSELKCLDAGSWFSREYASERIPDLSDVLSLCRSQVVVNVEIKPEAVDADIVRAVVDEVRRHEMEDQVIVSSFDPRALAQLAALGPGIQTTCLWTRELAPDPIAYLDRVGGNGLSVSRGQLVPEWIGQCHQLGLPISVYTVDQPDDMRRLIDLGVDALFTNHPDRLLPLRSELSRR